MTSTEIHPLEKNAETTRLETFSDGVMSIILTIIVLALQKPARPDLSSLIVVSPMVGGYVVSFIFVAIVWINHHHLFRFARSATLGVAWTNMATLLCMSMIPFSNAYLLGNLYAPLPTATCAVLFFACTLSLTLLSLAISRQWPPDHVRVRRSQAAIRVKYFISMIAYLFAAAIAFTQTPVALILIVATAAIHVIPVTSLQELRGLTEERPTK